MPFTPPENPKPVMAKFYVVGLNWQAFGVTLTMRPVTKGEDNKMWAAATPSGEIKMEIRNDLAYEQFAPDQEWEVLFTPVPKAEEPS